MTILPLLLAATLAAPHEIVVDTRVQKPISPYIYGVNYPNNWIYEWFKEWQQFNYGYTLARMGGNRLTAYNWETNASNAGADYFHENDDYLAMSSEPGWTVRHFLRNVQDTGAAALVTVPTLGYVSADKKTDLHGDRDVVKTPGYLNVRFHRSYASKPGRKPSYPPDLDDRAVYQDEFVAWVQRTKSAKTPVWFSLDNEPDWWTHTHPRIERERTTYKRIIENNLEYASMIKAIAPSALVFGPVNFGWSGIRDFVGAPDANGRPFTETYLDAVREASQRAGRRLVDVYDFHYYPETTGGGVRIIYNQAPDNEGTRIARIQAPRSLWDPTFNEGTWITKSLGDSPFMFIPRMQKKVDEHYPGTKLAITEYEFGGTNTVSGMLAQADALGVFGRFGLFAACHWGLNHTDVATSAGFRAFTDFDRRGARFGDRGLQVKGETPAENSVYAALDSGNNRRLTLVAINKTTEPMPVSVALRGFRGRSVRSFLVAEGSMATPLAGGALIAGERVTATLPPRSILSAEVTR